MAQLTDIPKSGGVQSKRKRWVAKAALLFLGALTALLAIGYCVENWRGSRRFARVKSRLAAKGESVDWKSFYPPQISDSNNVASHPFFQPMFGFKKERVANPKGGFDVSAHWLTTNGSSYLNYLDLPSGWFAKDGEYHQRKNRTPYPLTDLESWQVCLRNDTNFPSRSVAGSATDDVIFALRRFDRELRELHDALAI